MYRTVPVKHKSKIRGENVETSLRVRSGFRLKKVRVRPGWMDITLVRGGKEQTCKFAFPVGVDASRARVTQGDRRAQISAPVSKATMPGYHSMFSNAG